MGSEFNLRMGGYLRQRILTSTDIFLPVTEETRKMTVGRKCFLIKTGDQESSIRLVKDAARTTVLFTYPIDLDGDPKNGRLYLEDRFVFDPHGKELIEAGRSFHEGSGQGVAPWEDLLKRLRTRVPDLSPTDPAVKKFFNRVVLQLPNPIDEEPEPSPAKPSLSAEMARDRLPSLLVLKKNGPGGLLQNPPLEPRSGEKNGLWAERVDQITQQFSEQLFSLEMLASLFVGAAAFRLGERAVLFQKALKLRPLLLAAGAGLVAEAPAFEIARRTFHSPFPGRRDATSIADGILSNYLTFGALRGAGLGVRLSLASLPEDSLIYGKATFPILHHAASFVTLHGVQEAQRSFRSPAGPGSWMERLMGDGAFYLQASLAGRLAFGILGEPWRLLEFQAEGMPVPRILDLQIKLAAQTARTEELEGQLRRLRESAERVLENAEIRDRENTTLHSSLEAALKRAREFQERIEKLEAGLKKNKEGTEKVVEWARLKERENDSLRAGLQDALKQLEELSAERDRLATDLEEMKNEFVKRDQEAMRAERRAEDLEARTLVFEEEKTKLEATVASLKARLGSEPPPEQRISTIVLRGPDPEISDQEVK